MTYQLNRQDFSGSLVGVWRPVDVPVTGTVVLLGRPSVDWQSLHGWPLGLVEAGYRVVTVDVPNWGNQTDLNKIDAALAAQPAAETDRVALMAVGGTTASGKAAGACAATWARLHADRVASLQIVGSVVDLEEHYTRVTADQAAMNAAHGGNFTAAAPVSNPGRKVWRRVLRELVGDRTRMWWSDSDPTTPPAVHAAVAADIAGGHGITRGPITGADPAAVVPSSILAQLASMDAAWSNRDGTRQWAKIRDYALAAGAGQYAWADGMYSIPLPDGRTFWTTGDTFQGPINADGSRSGSLIRCAYIVQAAGNGAITQTIDEPNNDLALLHGVVEGSNVRVLANSIVDDHFEILSFNATTLARSDGGVAQQRPELPGMTEGGAAWGFHIQPHVDGYTYIYGPARFGFLNISEGTKVARVLTASGVMAAWEFYTGTIGGLPRWSTDPTKAVFMAGTGLPAEAMVDGTTAVGGGGATRLGVCDWVWAGKPSPLGGSIHILRGPGPLGPWRWVRSVAIPEQGQDRSYPPDTGTGWSIIAYNVNSHPHMASGPGKVVLSYNLTAFGGSGQDPLVKDSWCYGPRFLEVDLTS